MEDTWASVCASTKGLLDTIDVHFCACRIEHVHGPSSQPLVLLSALILPHTHTHTHTHTYASLRAKEYLTPCRESDQLEHLARDLGY